LRSIVDLLLGRESGLRYLDDEWFPYDFEGGGHAMGFFDFLLGARAPNIQDPDQLRDALFEAAATGPHQRLISLCRANRETITRVFSVWQTVPDHIRADPSRTQRYAGGLIAVVETFARDLGDHGLLQALTGSESSDPPLGWEILRGAGALMARMEYGKAAQILSDLLIDLRDLKDRGPDELRAFTSDQPIEMRDLKGLGSDDLLSFTYGSLGECLFHRGEPDRAIAPLQKALEPGTCQPGADGIVRYYLQLLYEVHRYLGQSGSAADRAEQLAQALDNLGCRDEASRFRKQARIVRAGEPLNRVVAIHDDRRYELDELPEVLDGRVEFAFERNRISLRPAEVLVARGERLGASRRWEEALAAFRRAAESDRFDPRPHYLSGLTLLFLKHYAEAVACFETTEALAPGWFHCRADCWLAQQLALGRFEHEAFLALNTLEDGSLLPEQNIELARQALDH
jgi:tetratricopeptide (TPR) repeat protein